MPYTRKTLRQFPEHTRKLARLLNELESVHRRLRNLIPAQLQAEIWARANAKRQEAIERGEL